MDTTGREATQEIYRLFDEVRRGFMADDCRRAKENPEHYRNSLTFEKGPRYRYFACPVKLKGWTLRFCYSTNRNIGGRYLSWTEAGKGKIWKRVGILSHETKRAAIERSEWKLAQMKKPPAERAFKPTI